MRRSLLVLMVLLAACTSGQEPAATSVAPTLPSEGSSTTSTEHESPPASIAPTSTEPEPTSTTTTLGSLESLAYEKVGELPFPIHMVPFFEGFTAVATKDGRVWLFDGRSVSEEPVLDIRGQVQNEGERGLLGIAVHPDDTSRFYAHYSANGGDTIVSEFRWANGELGDERQLLRVDQPAGNHNGGMIQFGPDGTLYLGLGDGGGSNDRFNNGQNRATLLGGLVAIDVDGGSEAVLHQYGLRNPWRFWIDGSTIYIADVGQGSYEEVSVAGLEPDLNYGWPITEGLHCFRPSSGCDTTGLTLPIAEIRHGDAGTCSITGGVVYRGNRIPELDGTLLFSDYCGGYLRGLQGTEVVDFTDDVGVPGRVASFGTDHLGDVYVLTTDDILRLVAVRG